MMLLVFIGIAVYLGWTRRPWWWLAVLAVAVWGLQWMSFSWVPERETFAQPMPDIMGFYGAFVINFGLPCIAFIISYWIADRRASLRGIIT